MSLHYGSQNNSQRRNNPLLTTRVVTQLLNRRNDRPIDESRRVSPLLFTKNHEIVGRESQLQLLEHIFHRIHTSHTSEIVMICGASGVVKSTLVHEYIKNLPKSVIFARGKFDQLRFRAPFSALISLSEHLCRQILRLSNSEQLREKIRSALGSEICLLGNLIPELAKLNGDASHIDEEVKEHNPGSSNRFKQLFRSLLRCVASEENPVVLFIDDLQWADYGSKDILESIMTDSLSKYILIICAHRDDEISIESVKNFNLLFDESHISMEKSQYRITKIIVERLEAVDLNKIISSALDMDQRKTESLSKLIWKKTNGSPFYLFTFLEMLQSTGLLSQQLDGIWTWDEKQIMLQTNVADNLAKVMESKLMRLPNHARSILQIASFIGYAFSIDVLSKILFEEQDMIEGEYSFNRYSLEDIQNQTSSALALACEEGLLEIVNDIDHTEFLFVHDKIRQVLYEDLMPDIIERQLLHQRIGFLLWDIVKGRRILNKVDEYSLFLAANNLNYTLNLIENSETLDEVIFLNLLAGKAAMVKSDFSLAVEYLRVAVNAVESNNSWESNYDLCIELFSVAAEVETVIGCYERSAILIQEIYRRANSFKDTCSAYRTELNCLAGKGDMKSSVLLGLKILRRLSMKFPRKITLASVLKEFLIVRVATVRQPLAKLRDLPEMQDDKLKFMISLLVDTILANCFLLGDSFKAIFAFFNIRTFRLTLTYGVSRSYAPMPFLAWGALRAVMGAFDEAMEAKKVAYFFMEKFNANAIKGRAIISSFATIDFWRNELNYSCCQEILSAYHLAMAFGDVFFAPLGIVAWIMARTYLDLPLSDIHPRMRVLVREMREEKADRALMLLLPNWQFLLNLCDETNNSDPSCLRGEAIDEAFAHEILCIDSKIALFRLKQYEMMTAYLYRNWEGVSTALSFFRTNEKTLVEGLATDFSHVWAAICYYDLYLETGNHYFKKEGHRVHQKVKSWADTGTQIFMAPTYLLNAWGRLCATKSNSVSKIELDFNIAIAACETAKCIIFQALGTERLARYFLTIGSDNMKVEVYQKEAVELYRRWGAFNRAGWLDNLDNLRN